MFAKLSMAVILRVLLIAVILFNALGSSLVIVKAESDTLAADTSQAKMGQLESHSILTLPTFERPKEKKTGRNENQTYESALMSNSIHAQMGQMQMYTATGEEGLRLAQDWIGWGNLAADWIVQKSASSTTNHEALATFYSSPLPKPSSVLQNFVGQIYYTVKPTEAGPNNWISFQLTGVATEASGDVAGGWDRARFFVDLTSPDGLPITCSEQTLASGYSNATAVCVQDSSSHVHGMADGGWLHYLDLQGPFNNGGSYARVAVKGLTAGQQLIVTFYTPINDLNTLSNCSLDGCIASGTATNGFTLMPINTRTGNYEYYTEDIAIPTTAGTLSFTRDYVSAITAYNSPLSPGWTHNLDTRLIFRAPNNPDPESLPGKVVFKAHTANKYVFTIDSVNNVYFPEPGLQAALVRNAGTPITYTLKDSGQKIYTFSETGTLLTYADAQGHTWTYTYYTNGKLDRVTADGGEFLDLDYDSQGRVNLVKDHTLDRSVSYHYNTNGDLDSFTDVLGQTWTYEYTDPNFTHYLTRVAAPGNVTVERTEYDPATGKARKQYDGNSDLVVELIYNTDGTTTIKDALNTPETHTYNDRGTLTGESNQYGGDTNKVYDHNFRPTSIIDPDIADPDKRTTTLDWSEDGANLEYIKDASGAETFIEHEDPNSPNNPTETRDALDNKTTYTYGNANFPTLPTKIEYFDNTPTLVRITEYQYYPPASGASAGKVELVTEALVHKTHYTYTSMGQPDVVITAYQTEHQQTTDYDYDDLGRLIKVTDPAGVITRNQYDAAGRLVVTINNVDPNNANVENPPQNSVSENDIFNLYTRYYYDVRGNQLAVVDTDWNITRTYYDLANRPIAAVQNLVINSTKAMNDTEVLTTIATDLEVIDNLLFDPDHSDWNMVTKTEYDDAGNVIATTDPAGIVTRTFYDPANRSNLTIQNFVGTGAYDPANPDQNIRTETFFDANGNLIAIKDTLDATTRTYYDELNRPVTTVQNLTGQAISVATPPGRGNSSNIRTDTRYDRNGNVIAIVDPNEITTRTYHDALNRPVMVVQNWDGSEPAPDRSQGECGDETNVCSETFYDLAGNAIQTVDPRGIPTTTTYDEANRPNLIVENSGGASNEIRQTGITYDNNGRRASTTDILGHVTQYDYNHIGQLVQQTVNYLAGNPSPNFNIVTQYTYDALGRQLTQEDALGSVTSNEYDDLGRLKSVTRNFLSGQGPNYKDTAGNQYNIVTRYAYDAQGNPIAQIEVKDAATNVMTRTWYDALGRSVAVIRNFTGSITDALPERSSSPHPLTNIRTDTVYLGNGNVAFVLDEVGKKTDYEYDEVGRVITIIDPVGNPIVFGYDANGNRTLMKTYVAEASEEEAVSTRYEYDNLNRLKTVIENYRPGVNPDVQTNVTTGYTYDASGNRLSIRDGNSNLPGASDYRTSFTYDALGRIKSETDPLDQATLYTYSSDTKGNIVSIRDAMFKTTVYHYDELDRLDWIEYPDPDENFALTADVHYEYDALGRRTRMTDGLGETTWVYNNLDLPETISAPGSSGISYDYDWRGNRSRIDYSGRSTVYEYNVLDQLDYVTGTDLEDQVDYEYDPAGRLKAVSRPNGVNSAYNYFDNGRLN